MERRIKRIKRRISNEGFKICAEDAEIESLYRKSYFLIEIWRTFTEWLIQTFGKKIYIPLITSVICVNVLVLSVMLIMQGDVVESDPFHPNGSEINVTQNPSVPYTTDTEAVHVIWRGFISLESLCIVLIILGICIIILQCIILKVILRMHNKVMSQNAEQQPQTVKPKPEHVENLEDSLCIVSFDESSSRTNHLSMTKRIQEYGEVKLQTKRVVIKKDSLDDLKDNIPLSKVFLVYIDYNEGNVILDKSECGIRRQTLKYLMKTNALVFIVYCLEKSSENSEELYAQKLTTVKNDPILVDLSKRDRIFSIYKTFSKKQMEVIIQGINEFAKQSV